MDQKSQDIVLINNSRTTWSTKFDTFEFLSQFTIHVIFEKKRYFVLFVHKYMYGFFSVLKGSAVQGTCYL